MCRQLRKEIFYVNISNCRIFDLCWQLYKSFKGHESACHTLAGCFSAIFVMYTTETYLVTLGDSFDKYDLTVIRKHKLFQFELDLGISI